MGEGPSTGARASGECHLATQIGWDAVGNKYVNLESLASASHWPNPTRSQRTREPGVAIIENTEGTEQGRAGWWRHGQNN